MDGTIHQRTQNPVLISLLSGFALGSAVVTAHEASSILTADGLHPAVVKVAGVIGTAGMGAVLLSVEVGLATLTTPAGLAMGALSTASGPMMTLGTIGTGLLMGIGLQAVLSWGVSGLLVAVATLLLAGFLTMSYQNQRQTLREWVTYLDASGVMVMLAVGFTGNFVGLVFGMAEGAYLEKWKGKALLWLAGVRVMLMILYLVLILLRVMMSKNLCIALGYLPYYSAINFLSFVFPMLVVLAGFLAGIGAASQADPESEAEVEQMLKSVLWVGILSAVLVGAALGTVAVVSLTPEVAGRVAMGAAVTSSVALRLILPACHVIGVGGSVGGLLGGAVVAGVSLVMASCSSPDVVAFVWCSFGALLGSGGFVSLGKMSTLTILSIAGGATRFPAWEEAMRLPFDFLLMSAFLETSVEGAMLVALLLGMTTLGSVLLGGAALWTAALGKVGTLGVVGAAVVSLGMAVLERVRTLEQQKTFTEIVGGLVFIFAILSGINLTYFLM